MLTVCDSITDDILQEDLGIKVQIVKSVQQHNYLEDTPGFLVDESTDPFDTTPPCKSPDSRLGDALHKISKIFKDLHFTWMLSLNTLRCLLAPPLPKPLPPLPLPVMARYQVNDTGYKADAC